VKRRSGGWGVSSVWKAMAQVKSRLEAARRYPASVEDISDIAYIESNPAQLPLAVGL